MPVIGSIIRKAVELKKVIPAMPGRYNSSQMQVKTLKKLLKKARQTSFGTTYHFDQILASGDVVGAFQNQVPIFDYNQIHAEWWHRSLQGETNVCWPGKIKYYALSSGTSEASSKYIPVSSDMLTSFKRTGVKQILNLSNFPIREEILNKGYLMIGGCTNLKSKGSYFEGDLSGITARNMPFWFHKFYKPGFEISKERDWNRKIEKIAEKAPGWDIGFIVGVPAWIQIILEKIIEKHQLKTIHDIWPNLSVYVHGGVSFEPYREGFSKLLGKDLIYIETYLASEGYIAYQTRPEAKGMQLALNNGIFFEFIPFNERNFSEGGDPVDAPEVLSIAEVQEGVEYAILLSTNSGAWRYLIGDTIRFADKSLAEIIITGRTKHFLSLCGEHLSVDNMNQAIRHISRQLHVSVPEYTVAGFMEENRFVHQWYLGVDGNLDPGVAQPLLDGYLMSINDDYRTERSSALKEIRVCTLPLDVFRGWMESKGKLGGQHKFPRVLKGDRYDDWKNYLAKNTSALNMTPAP